MIEELGTCPDCGSPMADAGPILGLYCPNEKCPADACTIEYVRKERDRRRWNLNSLAKHCHERNQHWWHDPVTGERLDRNKDEMLMLMVSEIAECMEGERKSLMDSHLPHRKSAEVELADLIIRLADYAGAYGFDLDGAVAEKLAYNATREDHRPEARRGPHGKKW
jgi:hypothetical protein